MLYVFDQESGKDTTGIYMGKPRYEDTTMQVGVEEKADQLKSLQSPINAHSQPVLIAKPDYLSPKSEELVSLLLLRALLPARTGQRLRTRPSE